MTHQRTANPSCLDAAGNRRVEQIKDPSGNVKRQLHRVYNQLGQLTQVLNAANDPVETSDTLDEPGITDGYDGNGNRVLSEDAFGIVTRQAFDPLNRLKATIQNAAGLDPATADTRTEYTYDTRDNLRQVTEPDGLNTVYASGAPLRAEAGGYRPRHRRMNNSRRGPAARRDHAASEVAID